jgi:hypothetical protein
VETSDSGKIIQRLKNTGAKFWRWRRKFPCTPQFKIELIK